MVDFYVENRVISTSDFQMNYARTRFPSKFKVWYTRSLNLVTEIHDGHVNSWKGK
jgi:hypothetical protein